jgi:hypothetical protein
MGIDSQVAFYHNILKIVFTGIIIGKEGSLYKISYFNGKTKVVAMCAAAFIIPFDT